jgi:PhnB protein
MSSIDFQRTVTPYLCTRNASRAIDFYKHAFGAVERVRLIDEGSERVSHAELRIGGAVIFLADEFPEIDVRSPQSVGGSPVLLVLDVENIDGLFLQAIKAGATVERAPRDSFDGSLRNGKLIDPFGHHWMITTTQRERLGAELERIAEDAA